MKKLELFHLLLSLSLFQIVLSGKSESEESEESFKEKLFFKVDNIYDDLKSFADWRSNDSMAEIMILKE